jgi:hypothetical protein
MLRQQSVCTRAIPIYVTSLHVDLNPLAPRLGEQKPFDFVRGAWSVSEALRSNERGEISPLCLRLALPGVLNSLLLGSSDPLGFGGGCEAGIGHHIVDGVSRLGDDHLQVHRGLVAVGDGEASGAVWVHNVGAGV